VTDTEGVRRLFDELAGEYDRHLPFFATFGRELAGWCGLRPGQRVLDVAAGRGAITLPAARAVGPRGLVLAVDNAPNMRAALARDRGDLPQVKICGMDAHRLAFPDASFDVVTCGLAFHIMHDPERAIAESYRAPPRRPAGVLRAGTGQAGQPVGLLRGAAAGRRRARPRGTEPALRCGGRPRVPHRSAAAAAGALRGGGLRRHRAAHGRADLRAARPAALLALAYVPRNLLPESPKSRAGRRTVSFPTELAPELAWHLERFAEAGAQGLVFVGPKGGTLRRSNFRPIWNAAWDQAGIPGLHFHDLRHVGGTLAAATGASLKELMARLGHSSTRAAMIYQHATRDRDEAIAKALGGLMHQVRSEPVNQAGEGT
jgi:SAM-dependent methyltransferase